MRHGKVMTAALAGLLLAWAAPDALRADVTATYDTKKGSMTIHYASPERVRIDLSEPEADVSMLLIGPKTYIIDPAGEAIDMEEWWAQMQGFGPEADAEPAEPAKEQAKVTFEPTGENVSVAGIQGEVHRVRVTEPDGSVQTQELVLSDSEALLEMWTHGVVAFFKRWARVSPSGGEAWFLPLAEQELGLLRADGYELTAFDRDPVDPTLFELD